MASCVPLRRRGRLARLEPISVQRRWLPAHHPKHVEETERKDTEGPAPLMGIPRESIFKYTAQQCIRDHGISRVLLCCNAQIADLSLYAQDADCDYFDGSLLSAI